MIRLGICTSLDHAESMKKAGFEYVELGFSAVASMSDEDFSILKKQAAEAPLPVEAMNSMLPGDFVLCSPDGISERLVNFLEKGFMRAAALGVKIVVFGSGRSRSLPEGMSTEEGLSYLEKYLRTAGPIAGKYGIRIAIEPLRAAESNIINFVSEAQALADRVGLPEVGALADLYHMMQGNEAPEAVEQGVIHCHIAANEGRRYPAENDGSEAVYKAFFDALKRSGYEGRVSIEGSAPEDFEAGIFESFAVLNALR